MEADNETNFPYSLVSFIVRSEDLEPDEITQVLSLKPDRSYRKGEYPRNNPKYSAYKQGQWRIDSKLKPEESFTLHLEHLLCILEPKRQQLLRLSEAYQLEIYCTLFEQVGFNLSPEILGRLADLKIGLGITSYP